MRALSFRSSDSCALRAPRWLAMRRRFAAQSRRARPTCTEIWPATDAVSATGRGGAYAGDADRGTGTWRRDQAARSGIRFGAHVCGTLRFLWRPLVPRWPGAPPADSATHESAAGMGITGRSETFGSLVLASDIHHDRIEADRDRTGTVRGRIAAANGHRPRGETPLPRRLPGDSRRGGANHCGFELRCPRARLPQCGFLSLPGVPQSHRPDWPAQPGPPMRKQPAAGIPAGLSTLQAKRFRSRRTRPIAGIAAGMPRPALRNPETGQSSRRPG